MPLAEPSTVHVIYALLIIFSVGAAIGAILLVEAIGRMIQWSPAFAILVGLILCVLAWTISTKN